MSVVVFVHLKSTCLDVIVIKNVFVINPVTFGLAESVIHGTKKIVSAYLFLSNTEHPSVQKQLIC